MFGWSGRLRGRRRPGSRPTADAPRRRGCRGRGRRSSSRPRWDRPSRGPGLRGPQAPRCRTCCRRSSCRARPGRAGGCPRARSARPEPLTSLPTTEFSTGSQSTRLSASGSVTAGGSSRTSSHGRVPRVRVGDAVVGLLLGEGHEADPDPLVVVDEVALDHVAVAARDEDAVAHREERHVDGRRVGLHVVVDDVAHDGVVATRVAQLVGAAVGDDPGPVVAEGRVHDDQVPARVRARVAEAVVLGDDIVDAPRRTGSTGRCTRRRRGCPEA